MLSGMMMRRLLPLMLLAGLTLMFFYQLAFTDLILARGDTFAYFYPYWHLRDALLAGGDLPSWSPTLFMGVPLLANAQLGTLYPPNWLTLAATAPDSIRIQIILHTFWAAAGAFALARQQGLSISAGIVTAAVFAFGGHVGAHVEQINQLQGLAWMPWLFYLLGQTMTQPRRFLPAFGVAWGLQLLCGHTQTVFITGVGLGVYGLALGWMQERGRRRGLPLVWVGTAAVLAVVIALPQLIPTQSLTSISNRGDGLNVQEATAFSLDPAIIGRGILPSYAGQPFSEYVTYPGVIALGLAVVGAFLAFGAGGKKVRPWLILAIVGLLLALGRFNPLYLLLAELPGFNLFRVPARWLALFTLGVALLAGYGTAGLVRGPEPNAPRPLRILGIFAGLMIALGIGAGFAGSATEPPVALPVEPSGVTLAGWAIAAVGFVALVVLSRSLWRVIVLAGVIPVVVIAELWLASHTLPYHDLSDPAVFNQPRFAATQLTAYGLESTPADRFLSVSNLAFDPGDKPDLDIRWQQMALSDQAQAYAFTATKLQETVAGNLPLVWDVPTIDGFDGGVLPTQYYTAFTSLILPDGSLRTVDGRLRENLAQAACGGICLPDDRWLDLTNTRYLLVDKVFQRVIDGIFYDTTFQTAPATVYPNDNDFTGTHLHLLYTCADDCDPPALRVDDDPLPEPATDRTSEGLTLARYAAAGPTAPASFTISSQPAEMTILALSWVDARTGDFVQLSPQGWRRVYSADVAIYENVDVMPRAFVVFDAEIFPDDWDGTEAALATLRAADFDPRTMLTLNTVDAELAAHAQTGGTGSAQIIDYTPTEIRIDVQADRPGWLVLTDAYYPGWRVDSGQPIVRGNVMFRAIPINGDSTLTLRYDLPFYAGAIAHPAGRIFILLAVGGFLLWLIHSVDYQRSRPSPA
jgi:hypothetical protein